MLPDTAWEPGSEPGMGAGWSGNVGCRAAILRHGICSVFPARCVDLVEAFIVLFCIVLCLCIAVLVPLKSSPVPLIPMMAYLFLPIKGEAGSISVNVVPFVVL
ncbi:hypothetical protein V8C35DRAFT_296142 [Trichoderma chlorosporum]